MLRSSRRVRNVVKCYELVAAVKDITISRHPALDLRGILTFRFIVVLSDLLLDTEG
jgi:hypothetical protein